jgi:hypothetical protein
MDEAVSRSVNSVLKRWEGKHNYVLPCHFLGEISNHPSKVLKEVPKKQYEVKHL